MRLSQPSPTAKHCAGGVLTKLSGPRGFRLFQASIEMLARHFGQSLHTAVGPCGWRGLHPGVP